MYMKIVQKNIVRSILEVKGEFLRWLKHSSLMYMNISVTVREYSIGDERCVAS